MRSPAMLLATILVLPVAACQSTHEERGALLGAAAGGLLGNQIGSGTGQVLASVQRQAELTPPRAGGILARS